MKIIIIILFSSLLFISCEKEFTGLVDVNVDALQVTSVSPFGSVRYNAIDSLVTLRINFTQTSKVSIVYCDIYSPDNKKFNTASIILYDNGNPEHGDDAANDNRFAARVPFSTLDPIGTYSIRYFVQEQFGKNRQVAQTSFVYDNGQSNVAPVISNLNMPASVSPGQTITFSIDVTDPNGLNDVEFVFYEAYNPDGVKVVNSQGISQFPMFDDGRTNENGDVTANDGTYTVRLTFPQTVQTGTWRFDFKARDRGGLFSNSISHNIFVE